MPLRILSTRPLMWLLGALLALTACGKNNDTPTEDMNSAPDAMMEPDSSSPPDMADAPDAPRDEDMGSLDMSSEPDMPADETIRIDGLTRPVKVRIDPAGVVFLECATDEDCVAAQGYMHAKHRFFAMDLIRRQTRGRLAAGLGSLALETDKVFRHIMTTRDGTPLEDAYEAELEDDTRAILEAYAVGVNAFLADAKRGEKGARMSEEYDFPLLSKEIAPWTPKDTIAVYMQLAYQLGETSQEELLRTEALATLGADASADIFNMNTGTDASVFGTAGVERPRAAHVDLANRESLRRRAASLSPAKNAVKMAIERLSHATSWVFGPRTETQGSNNWVLSSSRSATGNPLLANDPHLSLNNPAIWYYIVLDARTNGTGSIHVAGASIPAVPGIVVGHNGKVAWGTTTARLDMADVYIEKLSEDGSAVIHDGEEVEILQKDFEFDVHLKSPETQTFEWVPHHGPIVSKDVENRRAISVRWVAHEGGDDLNFFLGLMRANNAGEAREALQKIRTLNQSWVIADVDGEVAWYPHSYIPKRPWASMETPNWLALPGDGSAEWDGFMMGDEIPHVVDPPSGFIVTANGDFDGSYSDGDPFNDGHDVWQFYPTQGFRMGRAQEMIEEGGQAHTVDTMLAIQGDSEMVYARSLVPEILAAADRNDSLSDGAKAAVEALRAWNHTCPTGLDGSDPMAAPPTQDALIATESIGCAVFHVLLTNLAVEVFADELEPLTGYDPRANWYALQRAVHHVFTDPARLIGGEVYFDDLSTEEVEGKDEIVARTLEAASVELSTLFGSDEPDMWRWGRIHTLTLESFFSQAEIDTYNAGTWAASGGFETLDVAPPERFGKFDGDYGFSYGASLRIVMELDAESGISTHYQLPGGQIHLRDDPAYLGLLDDWLSNTPRALPYDLDAIEGSAYETFEIAPPLP